MTFCVMDTDCAVYDHHTKMAGLAYHNPLCQGCRDQLRGDLNLLRYDYVDLTQLIPSADTRNEIGKIYRPKPESKPPINTAVYNLRAQIAWFVAILAGEIRRHLGAGDLRTDLPVREGYALDHNVRWLAERVDDIAAMPATDGYFDASMWEKVQLDGPAMVGQIRALHRSARRMCGTDPRCVTLPGFCPDCNTPSLRRYDDNVDKIWCVRCKLQMDAAEYGRTVRLQIPVPRNPTA